MIEARVSMQYLWKFKLVIVCFETLKTYTSFESYITFPSETEFSTD